MEAVTFTLDLKGLPSRKDFIEAMAARMADLTPVWDWAHILYLGEVAQQFLTEGQYFNGSRWAPLNPQYERYKHRVYGIPPSPLGILYRTGRGFESLTNESSQDHVYERSATQAVWGSSVEYLQYHQQPNHAWSVLPQRRILRLRNRFKRLIVRGTLAYLLRGSTLPRGASEADHDAPGATS